MTARYAIYYAPTAQSDLWRKASAWIGRDAYTGVAIERPTLAGLDGLDLATLTADPRGYGFHATLKAPFELAAGATEADLLAAAEQFVSRQSAFDAVIAPAELGRFLAFRLQDGEAEMQALHAACAGLRALPCAPFRRRYCAPPSGAPDAGTGCANAGLGLSLRV